MSSSNFEDTNQPGGATSIDDSLLSSKDLRKISGDMKNELDIVIRAMEEAIKFSLDEKTKANALKSLVLEKEDEVRRSSEEIISIEKRIIKHEGIIAETERDLNNIKTAIDGIKEITSALDPLDAEKASGSLKGALMKKHTDAEKIRAELNSSGKLKDIVTRRLVEIEKSLEDTKRHYAERMADADTLVDNVEKSISQIVKTYNDIITVAKELLMENLGSRYSSIHQEFRSERNNQTTNSSLNNERSGDEQPLAT